MTADGSIDCMDAPQDQEDHVYFLHFAEVVAALRILDEGGNFVLKMFTFFEIDTINLLYLLNVCFDQVHVFKPVTSKPGNSEVYVISIGYQGNKVPHLKEHLQAMTKHLGQNNKRLMFSPGSIPKNFIDQVAECAQCFMEHQVAAIETNIQHYHIITRISAEQKIENERAGIFVKQENLQELRNAVTRTFFRYYRIEMIPRECRLITAEHIKLPQNMNIPIYSYAGSFADRQKFLTLGEQDKIIVLRQQVMDLSKRTVQLTLNDTIQLKSSIVDDTNILNIRYGQPIMSVVSSKFILIQSLKLLLEVQRNIQSQRITTQPWTIVCDSSDSKVTITVKDSCYGFNYNTFEKGIFRKIFELLDKFELVCIEDFLLLTHFSVGMIWVLGQRVCNDVYLTNEGHIRLTGIRSNGRDFLKNHMATEIFGSTELAVVSIVKLSHLRNEDFYNAIFAFNNNLCLKYCDILLQLTEN